MGARYLLLLLGVMALALLAGATSYQLQQQDGDRIPFGWHVADVDLSATSLYEAKQRLERFAHDWRKKPFTIEVRNAEGTLLWQEQTTRERLGASVDVEATLQQLRERVAQRSPWQDLAQALVPPKSTQRIEPIVVVAPQPLQEWMERCQRQVETSPRDARLRYLSSGQWQLIPEQWGVRLQADALQRVVQALQQSETYCLLIAEPVSPRVTRQHLQQIDSEWTVATTRYSERERDRSHNIRKASQSINGLVLLPGDVFSYNEVVGPRTLKEGFRRAPVIVRGELVPGDGGGVCQVSTTLYIAALQAGLQIVQRSKHAFPIGYAPPGLDATVVYGAIDLRFRNNTPSPLAIVTEAKGGRMTVRILGASLHRRSARIERVVHAVIPPPVKTFPTEKLPAGVTKVQNKGQRGWRVSVYRVITEPGKPPVREKVGTDYYRPQARVVLVGQARPQSEPSAVSSVSSSPSEEEQP